MPPAGGTLLASPSDQRTVTPLTQAGPSVSPRLARTTRNRSRRFTVVGNVGDDDAVGQGHLRGTEFEDAARLSVRTDRTVPRDNRPDQCVGATGGEDPGSARRGVRIGVAGGVVEHLA